MAASPAILRPGVLCRYGPARTSNYRIPQQAASCRTDGHRPRDARRAL